MTLKLTTTTTAFVRALSAVGALSVSMSIPSIGATTDIPKVDSGMLQTIEGRPAQTLTHIDVHPGTDDIRVVIFGDGMLAHEVTRLDEHRLMIDIAGVSSSIRKPVISVNHQVLKQVRLGYHADRVRVVLDLAGSAAHTVEPQGANLIVTLREGARMDKGAETDLYTDEAVKTKNLENPVMPQVQDATSRTTRQAMATVRRSLAKIHVRPVAMTSEADSDEKTTPKEDLVVGETHYVGRRISLDFQQADISNVLRLIAEVSGFNMVVGEGVKSKVTMKLVSVPWDQALDMILKMNGLGKIRQGNILWIDSLANIAKQQNEEAQAKDAKVKAEELVDRVFYIRNLQVQELMTSLRQYVSPRGLVQMSPGSNALIVRDTESKIAVMKQLVDGLDLEVPQVQIEARIVQADTTYSRSLGVQWGIQNVNQLGPAFGVANFKTGNTGPFGGQTSNFLVNLPATVGGLASTPGVGFTIGKTDGALLDVRLSAGELLGLSKVIAAPKVTTLDKREAKISQGESIPFQTTSLQGTQTTFVDANLELNVTPQITSRDPKEIGKQIMMKVRATRNAVGARSNPAGPSIDRREANTQVIIRDGETMVIGGVFIDTQNNNVIGIPYLSRVPVLGWLFKQKSEAVAKQELLIFLTPSIVKS
jgi:type IV pilus assembly protein PilQ